MAAVEALAEIADGDMLADGGARGTAQALALAGWALEDIKLFGRWMSAAVEVYLLDVPMRTHARDLADSMVHGIRGASEGRGHGPVTSDGRDEGQRRGSVEEAGGRSQSGRI